MMLDWSLHSSNLITLRCTSYPQVQITRHKLPKWADYSALPNQSHSILLKKHFFFKALVSVLSRSMFFGSVRQKCDLWDLKWTCLDLTWWDDILAIFSVAVSFFFSFSSSLFSAVCFIRYFMIWVVNSSDSKPRTILHSDNLYPPGFPHE